MAQEYILEKEFNAHQIKADPFNHSCDAGFGANTALRASYPSWGSC